MENPNKKLISQLKIIFIMNLVFQMNILEKLLKIQ